jgi:integral membrane protein
MYRILHLTSRLEATSYLILLAATAVKYGAGNSSGVTLVGPIHGVLYLIFVAVIIRWFTDMRWSFKKALAAMVLGSLPLGGFLVDRWIGISAGESK